MSLGDVIQIDDRTVLVTGQELDIEANQPDVSNVLLHRVGSTLVMVDTGVTAQFRAALLRAVDLVGPWTELLLLTTHGHVDHIGNNDLADELHAARGVRVQHFVPARDLAQMLDPHTYWERSFERLDGVVGLPAQPALVATKVTSLFTPLHPFGATTRTYEELPLEQLVVGGVPVLGWTFADGAVRVLRSQGHCAGHVVVHLRDNGVLHLGDEVNGPCGIMRDADQLKIQTTFATTVAMIDAGEVSWVTDGHEPEVLKAVDARTRMEGMLAQVVALQSSALGILGDDRSVHPRAFVEAYAQDVAALGVGGANPNAHFTGFMALNALREVGLRPTGSTWSRRTLTTPAIPGRAAIVGALPGLVWWRLRRKDVSR